MHYIVDLEEISEDMVSSIDSSIITMYFKQGRYLHIYQESLSFYRAHEILAAEYEFIDLEKLKEILLIKHLRS